MTVSRLVTLTASSPHGFEDAVKTGILRANESLRTVELAAVQEQHVIVRDGVIAEYRVQLKVTFARDAAT